MNSIKRLERSVASRIAAGEVVERPVSAVKELIENSIDASSKEIKISLEQGGKASLVVEDDGVGIAFDELPLALERYATSKISTLRDLETVSTLGYRGEALSSMAAVGRMEIRSRRAGCDEGGMICVEGGEIKSHSMIPARQGTRVRVDDLFFNMPARRKFLKSASAELRRVIQTTHDLAVVNPDIRFRLSNDGKEMLDLGGVSSSEDVIRHLWGEESRFVSAEGRSDDVRAKLWWNALPGSKRVIASIFVNGRRVQDSTVRGALSSTGSSIYGEWIIVLTLPPEEVDVNIHPAKAEIRFRRSGPVFDAVRRAADQALRSSGGFFKGALSPVIGGGADPALSYRISDDRSKREELFSRIPDPPPAPTLSDGSLFTREDAGPRRRYMGQAQGGYLVFDDPRGLCLLDAHAAHERILYEQIEDGFISGGRTAQRLVCQQELPPAIVPSVEMYRAELHEMGFSFSLPDDGDGAAMPTMTSLPSLRGIGRLSAVEMLRSAIKGIEEEEDPSKRDREVWWRWARMACRDAVKLGASFTEEEAMDLFDRLERCRSPYSCPHGRPTTIFLAGERLKSWFER